MDPSDLENMTPEEIEQLVALGVIPEQMSSLDKQMKLADELRNKAGPEGRNSGRVYTAANPMEHIGTAMQQYAGQRDYKSAQQQQADLLRQQTQGRNKFLEKYLFPAGPRPQSIKGQMTPDPFDPTKIAPPRGF